MKILISLELSHVCAICWLQAATLTPPPVSAPCAYVHLRENAQFLTVPLTPWTNAVVIVKFKWLLGSNGRTPVTDGHRGSKCVQITTKEMICPSNNATSFNGLLQVDIIVFYYTNIFKSRSPTDRTEDCAILLEVLLKKWSLWKLSTVRFVKTISPMPKPLNLICQGLSLLTNPKKTPACYCRLKEQKDRCVWNCRLATCPGFPAPPAQWAGSGSSISTTLNRINCWDDKWTDVTLLKQHWV